MDGRNQRAKSSLLRGHAFTDKEWHDTFDNTPFLISTRRDYLSLPFIHKAFESPDLYWANDISDDHLKTMLNNSLTLGLYSLDSHRDMTGDNISLDPKSLEQIGMARFITDYISFAWLTDVYVSPAGQGKGLGRWLVKCCKEFIDEIPELRRAMLITGTPGKGLDFYTKELGMVREEVRSAGKTVVMTTPKKEHQAI
ncbi:hypothetical protein LTS18_009076 [Coniosporium uncinatum]|uniref:Uncharacterized protein n=1 Tax=Coniosporium uncinatum TaxID=93489 RepID=A0ACC3D0W5_9PEZI|nr:hypothetical protein LTS18_009076 [Coniosporium uncinatum]